MSRRRTRWQCWQAILGTRTSRRVILPQVGAWASRRATVPARRPCAPQEAQNKRSSTMSKTGRASTTRSHRPSAGSMTRWPVARRPRGSRPSRASGSIGSKRALARARAVAFNIASGSSGRRWIVQRHPSSPPGPRRPLSTPARPPPLLHPQTGRAPIVRSFTGHLEGRFLLAAYCQ